MSARVTFLQPPEAVKTDEAAVLIPAARAAPRRPHGDNFVWVVRDGTRRASRAVETARRRRRPGPHRPAASRAARAVVVGDVALREGQRVAAQ